LYKDYREMLAREEGELDVVSIATPDKSHAEIALAVLALNKNVFLEKPMCRTLEEADRIVEGSEVSRGKIMVDFLLRFDPRYVKAREIVERGDLGKVLALHARRHASSEFAKTQGRFSNLFRSSTVHDIDLILWLTSAFPDRVYATGNKSVGSGGRDDSVMALLEFQNAGVIASIDANWVLPRRFPSQIESELRIVGSKGIVDIVAQDQGLEKATAAGLKKPDLSFWPVLEGRIGGALKNAVDHFIHSVRTDSEPSVGPREGRNSLKVALALEESARTHQPIKLVW
jgi:predicted dehydrogenase